MAGCSQPCANWNAHICRRSPSLNECDCSPLHFLEPFPYPMENNILHTHTHTYDDSNRGRKSSRRKLRPLIAFRIDPEPVSRPFNRSRDLVIIAERDYIRARLILSWRLNTSIGVPGLCRLSWRNYLDYSLCWILVVQGCVSKNRDLCTLRSIFCRM